MSHQTTMNGKQRNASPAAGVGRNVAGLMHDLISLAELQFQLAACDAREGLAKSRLPLLLLVGAVLLALGTVPVILLGIGWALVNIAGLSEGAAFLLVSLSALGVASIVAWWSVKTLKSALSVVTRSRHELLENVRWIKRALLQHETQAELYRQRV